MLRTQIKKAFDAETADAAMAYALSGTEWKVGTVTTKRTWTSTEKNALSILRNVADLHGGDLVFDCPNRLVHLLTLNGKDSGALFMYGKNMKDIERTVDTTGLVTRLYAVGADGMTFASINGGKPYVEDFTYSREIRVSSLDCSAFTNPYQMLEFTRMRLADYCKPTVSYVLNAMDLLVLTGYEHEAWELGDYVRVEDRDLNISVTTRIVRREYNLQNARVAQNQGEYAKRYDALVERFEMAKARLEEVQAAITEKQAQWKMMENFMEALRSLPEQVDYFDEAAWYAMVDFVTVYGKEDVRFTFKNGMEVPTKTE